MTIDGARWDSDYHAPAMAAEIVQHLASPRDAARGADRVPVAIDGTLGGGGHTQALLESGFRVIAFDRDPDAIAAAGARLAEWRARGLLEIVHANYADADEALGPLTIDAVLLDLGISSHQIDDAARGFSFRQGAPLDMRMGSHPGAGAPDDAATLLNERDEREIARIFHDYGDEPRAHRLARAVTRRRATRPFVTSDDLVGAIRGALGARSGPGDFARLFQAVRIAVNDEIAGLERALPVLRDRLRPGGRFAVLTYHSGEDRIVKHAFRAWSTAACVCPPLQPACTCGARPLGRLVTRKGERATADEIARNVRARSAMLRVWERASEHTSEHAA